MNPKTDNCGIYSITHIPTDKKYIGSTRNFKHRLFVHRWHLKRGDHGNDYLQNSWEKYGESEFIFSPLIVCAPRDLVIYEQILMDGYKSYDNNFGFNLRPKAENNTGYKYPPGRISKLKGRPSPIKGTKRKFAKRVPLSPEHKEKIRFRNIGKTPWNKGVPVTEKTRNKISLALKGKSKGRLGKPHTEETKRKLSCSQKRRLRDPLAREKQRTAKLGKKVGPYKSGNAVKTHCPKGHPYSGENLYLHPKANRRGCRACIKISNDKFGGAS